MKNTENNDNAGKKRFIVILSVLLVLSIGLGITFAIALRKTESRANTFTFGNIKIELSEDDWDELTAEDKITYPGRSILKDPKVKNTGKTDAYLYLEIKIPRKEIRTVNGTSPNQIINPAATQDLFTYNINSGWTQIGSGTVSEDGNYTEYKYAYTDKIIAPGESTPTLFDSVKFVNALEGEPEMGTELEIPVNAIGIQSEYLNETGNTLAEKIVNAYITAKSIES